MNTTIQEQIPAIFDGYLYLFVYTTVGHYFGLLGAIPPMSSISSMSTLDPLTRPFGVNRSARSIDPDRSDSACVHSLLHPLLATFQTLETSHSSRPSQCRTSGEQGVLSLSLSLALRPYLSCTQNHRPKRSPRKTTPPPHVEPPTAPLLRDLRRWAGSDQ